MPSVLRSVALHPAYRGTLQRATAEFARRTILQPRDALSGAPPLSTRLQYAMGVRSPSDKLELIEYTPPVTGDYEVLVDVQYCGASSAGRS